MPAITKIPNIPKKFQKYQIPKTSKISKIPNISGISKISEIPTIEKKNKCRWKTNVGGIQENGPWGSLVCPIWASSSSSTSSPLARELLNSSIVASTRYSYTIKHTRCTKDIVELSLYLCFTDIYLMFLIWAYRCPLRILCARLVP